MKTPIKPLKPLKPIPPNKEQKIFNHPIDITKLFLIEKFYDEDGNEISGNDYDLVDDTESEEFTPSLKSLIKLVPDGIDMSNIFLNLKLGYDIGRDYISRPFESMSLFYTTPFDYKKELEKYNKKISIYEKDIEEYNSKMITYKKDLEEYKMFKKKAKIAKRVADLEEQLKRLE